MYYFFVKYFITRVGHEENDSDFFHPDSFLQAESCFQIRFIIIKIWISNPVGNDMLFYGFGVDDSVV